MAEPTASLTIVRAGADLVFSGVEDGTPYGLLSMNEPPLRARVTYADESPHVSGALPTQAVWQLSMLNATICLSAQSQVELEALKTEVRQAIKPLMFTAVQTINGYTLPTWSCIRGSMEQSLGQYELPNLSGLYEVYDLSIPVQPLEE